MDELNFKLKKIEKDALSKFKDQNKLLKKFGKKAMLLYKSIDEKEKDARLLLETSDMNKEEFMKVINFMKENEMIEISEGQPVVPKVVEEDKEKLKIIEEKQEPEQTTKQEVKEESIETKEEPSVEEPSVEVKPEQEEEVKEEVNIEPEIPEFNIEDKIKAIKEKAQNEKTTAEQEIKIEPEVKEEQDTNEPEEISIEPEIKEEPIETKEEEQEESQIDDILKKKESINEKIKQIAEQSNEEISIEPEIKEEPIETKEEPNIEEPSVEVKPEQEEEVKEEVNIEPEVKEEQSEPEINFEEQEEEEKSPMDKILEKYGEQGLKVYSLIDGKKSVGEIAKEVGTTQEKVIEMLDFMEREGIVKMDKPVEEEAIEQNLYTPMVGGEEELMNKEAEIVIPVKEKNSLMQNIKVKASLMLKFGEVGSSIYNEIDGRKNEIDIMTKLQIPLKKIEEVIDYLEKEKIISKKNMQRSEIRKRFGEDGYIIYKKYGKAGLALYEMVGSDKELKDMAKLIGEPAEKIADMFIFIHKVLGIELPVDRDMIIKQIKE